MSVGMRGGGLVARKVPKVEVVAEVALETLRALFPEAEEETDDVEEPIRIVPGPAAAGAIESVSSAFAPAVPRDCQRAHELGIARSCRSNASFRL